MGDTEVGTAAVEIFDRGCNCAEAVLQSLAQALEIDCGCAPRIASGFGAGFGKQGSVCGAVSGGIMAIGLKHGRNDIDDDPRSRVYPLVAKFMDEFKQEFGTYNCGELTGCDLMTPEGNSKFVEMNLKETLCAKAVAFAAASAYRLLSE